MAHVYHVTVHYSGRVQGVGFRYSALETARGFDVTGFVTNLPDGRVQLEAEGAVDEVDAYVAAVEEKMHGYIRKSDRSSSTRAAQFSGFSIV